MDPALVFAKSAKGREEIEKRTYRVDSRRRMLLITVDGAASAEQLIAKYAHLEDAAGLLQSLWSEGFIEPAGEFAGSAIPTQAESPAPTLNSTRSLQELQRIASRTIENLLGPEGENMALRLEKTKDLQQFLAEAQRTREALRSFSGQRKADAFWAALGL